MLRAVGIPPLFKSSWHSTASELLQEGPPSRRAHPYYLRLLSCSSPKDHHRLFHPNSHRRGYECSRPLCQTIGALTDIAACCHKMNTQPQEASHTSNMNANYFPRGAVVPHHKNENLVRGFLTGLPACHISTVYEGNSKKLVCCDCLKDLSDHSIRSDLGRRPLKAKTHSNWIHGD